MSGVVLTVVGVTGATILTEALPTTTLTVVLAAVWLVAFVVAAVAVTWQELGS